MSKANDHYQSGAIVKQTLRNVPSLRGPLILFNGVSKYKRKTVPNAYFWGIKTSQQWSNILLGAKRPKT